MSVVAVVVVAAGCGTASQPGSQGPAATANTAKSNFVVADVPADAKGVAAVREAAKNDEEIIIVGRIGGSEKPFVQGVAAFTIVDPALAHCSKEEGCPTPWDYCCETDKLKTNMAMVKFVDQEGKPVNQDARELLGVEELSKVTIHGKAKRDEDGNLTVLADKVHIAAE